MDDVDVVSPEEAIGRIEAAVQRFLRDLRITSPDTLEGERQREKLCKALEEDPGAAALLIASYREGVRDSAVQISEGNPTTVGRSDPGWADVASQGDLMMKRSQEHVCGRCIHEAVCEVGRAKLVMEQAVVVTRCLTFSAVE